MTILFVNLDSKTKTIPMLLETVACKVISTVTADQALLLIRDNCFDAVVIQEAGTERETINFTLDAYRTRPGVPVFLMNDWGTDLVPALRSLRTFSDDATDSGIDERSSFPAPNDQQQSPFFGARCSPPCWHLGTDARQ